ncbi:MAG: zinc-binding dehydrogenase [Chloroflexota bacterium]|nr:zinc-binding dehydrogenase [Chloroflexota bacterium]MDE2920566.1 zinc-binding dehydrogenase [Chloroflexota bacterium]
MTGRAAVVPAANVVHIEEIPIPGPIGPNEVLVQTECTFISAGTELANFTGLDPGVNVPGSWNHFPARPGYANCGRVIELGSDVESLAVGDRVFTQRKHVSHHLVAVDDPDTMVVPVPADVPSDLAAAVRMGMVAITAPQVADNNVNDWVVVFGLGLVGNLAAQLFQLDGARVIGVDPVPARRQLAHRVGIQRVIGDDMTDIASQVRDITGGGAQTVVEAVGHAGVAETAIHAAAPFGELILLGSPRAPVTADLNEFLQPVHKSWVAIKGALEHRLPINPTTRGHPRSIAGNARIILNLVSSGRLRLAELISHRLPANQIAAAYDGLLNKPNEYWGVALDWR